MARAPRVCTQPGCPAIAGDGGRCPDHKRKAWARSSGQSTRTNKAWRKAVLQRDDYTCRKCGRPATEADHIINRAAAPALELDIDNGQALCKTCHQSKTATEAARAR